MPRISYHTLNVSPVSLRRQIYCVVLPVFFLLVFSITKQTDLQRHYWSKRQFLTASPLPSEIREIFRRTTCLQEERTTQLWQQLNVTRNYWTSLLKIHRWRNTHTYIHTYTHTHTNTHTHTHTNVTWIPQNKTSVQTQTFRGQLGSSNHKIPTNTTSRSNCMSDITDWAAGITDVQYNAERNITSISLILPCHQSFTACCTCCAK